MFTYLFLLPFLPVIISAIPFPPFLRFGALSKTTTSHTPPLLLFATSKDNNVPIEESPIAASDRGFYINRPAIGIPCPASAHCDVSTTTTTTTTAIIINADTTARLYSVGPSKNEIFVNGSCGALTYNPTYGTNTTLANFTSSPGGFLFKDPGRADYNTNHTASNSSDIAAGFSATSESTDRKPGRLTFQGKKDGEDYADLDEFWACPTGEEDPKDVYRIFVGNARLAKRCFGIEIATRNMTSEMASAVAWGY